MSLLVTGSIGIDTVETPFGKAEGVLGGSAVYFSLAASLFNEVRMVGVVGEDFDHGMFDPLRTRPIDIAGVEVRRGSNTFRWHGRYVGAMNEAHTIDVKLNVLAEKNAAIPDQFRDSRYVFLANTHPAIQREIAARFSDADLIVCDTMNLWIEHENAELRRTLGFVHGVVLNEGEARLFTGKSNLVLAGQEILKMGPRFVMIKKGEHGSLMVAKDDLFVLPAYPTTNVVDPTGCGDCFAGAMMGYIASSGRVDNRALRAGMARGSVVASFVIETFSVVGLSAVDAPQIDSRLDALRAMARFE